MGSEPSYPRALELCLDANCCFDALSCSDRIRDWSMNTIISNISSLAANFPDFKFSWVQRTCNSAAHVTALLDLP